MKSSLRLSVRRALLVAGIVASGAVLAEPQSTAETSEISEIIIVTGSFIRGTAEDAALPVSVLTSDDIAKQGSPSMPDLIKSIPAMQSIMGETNQFGAGQSTGSSNVNLRGLGATRTLVLLNGRRVAANPAAGVGVDTNLLPTAAIGRIEVLKDGAAATYGSDAIAGVVNFITRDNLDGLVIDGSYSYIDGGDGDYGANLAWGWRGESSRLLLAGGYRHRSEVSTLERDWAVRSFTDNPQGGWSGFGNPGTYVNGATGARFLDPACPVLGIPTGAGATLGCQFQYIAFDNIVEDEDHYQAYAKYDLDINDSVSFYAEALYAAHDVPRENSSPSYGPTQGATGGVPNYVIPAANPGVQNLVATGVLTSAVPVVASGLLWRPLANGGNPLTGEGKQDKREFDSWRLSAGFNGTVGSSLNWDTAVTYSESGSDIATPDIVVSRLGLALSGLGGPNCTGTTAGQGGCLWFNPFSSSYAGNPMTGVANPYYVPSLENSREVIDWMFEDYAYESTNKLLVVDAVLSGEMGWTLPGGAVGWAAGAQYRDSNFVREVNDISNIDVNPCAQTPITGTTACTAPGANPGPNGALSFFGPLSNLDLKQDVYAVFGELNLPVTDSFQAQLAVRYEDYGGNVGSTTNPKLALRWQVFDALALRGSVGTTFRAPPEVMLDPGYTTTLTFTAAAVGYRPYDTYGNPDLEPETADTFNFGFIVQAGGFNATVDYWKFKFEDALISEPGPSIVASVLPSSSATAPNNCNDPAYAGLVARMTFAGGVCSPQNLIRTRAGNINGPDVDIAGIDASASFVFSAGPGDMTLGLEGTYNLEFESDALVIEGIVIEQAGDRIGTRGTSSGTLPQWRASAYVDFGTTMHNVRWTTRYVDGVEDGVTPSRAALFATNPNGIKVKEWITSDLSYRLSLPSQTTIGASVFNVFDEDPPFARLDLSYDPFIGNPLGRYYKVSVSQQF